MKVEIPINKIKILVMNDKDTCLSNVADDKDGTILEGLEGGAAVFIAKPISDDLRDLWLYATLEDKKGKRAVVFIHNVFNARLGTCWSTTPTLHCLSPRLFGKRKLPMLASFHSRLPGLRQLQHQ
ncbi:hypothetical protein RND71_037434 [Anisodus tanguticus]|uniref:Uncharacterized protein n=1 Tax=Anisodus tanguticus TaxID=243964 RepID=A0AAE1R331_9SOLA|nr:hypothetical protein RND71_037434 [Anisodus tanguticus]